MHSLLGEMAEWSIAAVLKTVEVRASGGSNPSLSAIYVVNQQVAKYTHDYTHTKALIMRFFCIYTNKQSINISDFDFILKLLFNTLLFNLNMKISVLKTLI